MVYVNIPGLAIGLSAVILLSIYLKHELSFDKHFKNKDHVVRLYNSVTANGNSTNYGICLRKSYTELPGKVPEIESATQIYRGWTVTTELNEERYPGLQLLYADKDFFDVFGLELIYGNKKEALTGLDKIVLKRNFRKKNIWAHRLCG